jgi:hypothetical protein
MIVSLVVLHHKIEKEKTLPPSSTSATTVDNQSNCNERLHCDCGEVKTTSFFTPEGLQCTSVKAILRFEEEPPALVLKIFMAKVSNFFLKIGTWLGSGFKNLGVAPDLILFQFLYFVGS